MNYLSVCSGIEAATVAWHPLGWCPVAFAQFDPEHDYKRRPDFASRLLAHHYPSVPNLGDMTKFKDWPDADVDVLVGGTPCQSFSVAGLRKGMADPRGNLALVYLAIADRYRPEWVLWENVPGILSSGGGRDFGSILGGMAELGYGLAYRVLDAQYVRVDGFARAVPQRRRRVFVVGYLGDWRRAAAVLFEPESLSWNSPPRRQARQDVAGAIGAGSRRSGGRVGRREAAANHLVAGSLGAAVGGADDNDAADGRLIASTGATSHCLNAGSMGRQDYETETVIAHALRADGFDASEDGTGRGTPLIPIAFDTTQITSKTCRSNPQPGDPCHPLAASAHAPSIAQPVADTLRAHWERSKGAKAGNQVGLLNPIISDWAVRRLTPRECERLQGFPDDYTNIPGAADGPRYKALGNSMAVNVMRWLGRRIEMVEALQ